LAYEVSCNTTSRFYLQIFNLITTHYRSSLAVFPSRNCQTEAVAGGTAFGKCTERF
jgi:hypothetical protein